MIAAYLASYFGLTVFPAMIINTAIYVISAILIVVGVLTVRNIAGVFGVVDYVVYNKSLSPCRVYDSEITVFGSEFPDNKMTISEETKTRVCKNPDGSYVVLGE